MIFLDDFVYSLEIFEFYNEKQKTLLDFEKKKSDDIQVFISYFYSKKWPTNYYQLDFNQIYEFFFELFKFISNFSNQICSINTKFTINDIDDELKKIYRAILFFCFVENLEDVELNKIDYMFVDKKNKSLNQHFRYRIFYMYKEIESQFLKLKNLLQQMCHNEIVQMKKINNYSINIENIGNYIFGEIRNSIKGDNDEFIIYCINSILVNSVTKNHEKIAQLIRYIKFDDKNFDKKLPIGQIVNTIFGNIFDGIDEIFTTFYENKKNECIIYFLSDYLMTTFDIIKIPFYNIFTLNKGKSYTDNILYLLNIKNIKSRIKNIHKLYENS